MKKLVILLSLFLLAACDTVQDRTDNYVKRVCYEGVTYLIYDSPTSDRLGMSVQLDIDGKIVPCQVAQNEDGKKVYWKTK